MNIPRTFVVIVEDDYVSMPTPVLIDGLPRHLLRKSFISRKLSLRKREGCAFLGNLLKKPSFSDCLAAP